MGPPLPPKSAFRRFEPLLVASVVGLTILLYFWSSGLGSGERLSRDPAGYYNLQTEGFRMGHLYAAVDPDPRLLALADPYDPSANAPYRYHDMTLWAGRYYLYYGVAPILLVFLPFRLITGHFIGEPTVVALFDSLGFVMAVGLLLRLRRQWFPEVGSLMVALLVAVLGLGSPVIFLVQQPQFYQVPISCAYALTMAGLFCAANLFIQEKSSSPRWLVWSGIFFGLTMAARPNYVLAMPFLGLLVGWWMRKEGRPLREWKAWIRPSLLAFGPVASIGLALLLYNDLRFSDPFEFGMRYQLAGQSFLHFTPLSFSWFAPHFSAYTWKKVWWLPYFPFLEIAPDAPFGVFRYLPILWLGVAALVVPQGGWDVGRALRVFGGFLAGSALAILVTDSLFFFDPELRYVSDFTPLFLILGALGALRLCQLRSRATAAAVSLVATASIAISASVFVQRLPASDTVTKLASAANQLSALTDSYFDRHYGGLELHVVLPASPTAQVEPLFQTGYSADRRDWLQIHYLENGRAQLGFFHAGLGEILGKPFSVPPDRQLTVTVYASEFLPPSTHPFFSKWSAFEVEAARRRLWVGVNGTAVLEAALECYPSRPTDLLLGHLGFADQGLDTGFTGTISSARQIMAPRLAAHPREIPRVNAMLRIKLRFPAGGSGYEPLIATGEKGRGQLIYLIYGPGNTVQFALDTFGQPPRISVPVRFQPVNEPDVLTVWLGAWADPSAPPAGAKESASGGPEDRLFVSFDGQELFNEDHHFFPSASSPTALGWNRIDSGAAAQEFSGSILSVENEPLSELPALGAIARVLPKRSQCLVRCSLPLVSRPAT